MARFAWRSTTESRQPLCAKLQRLEENIGAAAIQLTSDDLREIDSTASKVTVQGARYPEQLNRMVGW